MENVAYVHVWNETATKSSFPFFFKGGGGGVLNFRVHFIFLSTFEKGTKVMWNLIKVQKNIKHIDIQLWLIPRSV